MYQLDGYAETAFKVADETIPTRDAFGFLLARSPGDAQHSRRIVGVGMAWCATASGEERREQHGEWKARRTPSK
ncbi:hypothetical protein ASA1KI_35620 [Opitutales bacterium ASA1]|nr:hypothetical protein ASA1KI_35620 [Opitutales bacterium ASA1]